MPPPPEIQIRGGRLADEHALAQLDATAWNAESGFPSVLDSAAAADHTFFSADNPPEVHLVAEIDGNIVGYVRLKAPSRLPENRHVLQVQGLAVDPAARRRGVAAALLAASEEYARERGTRRLSLRVLSTNQAAIGLYERLGFVRDGVLPEEFCINGGYVDDVLMSKRLASKA